MKKSELRQIIREELDESIMTRYNYKEGEKYFSKIDNTLILIQDIKRWLYEMSLASGNELGDETLIELKKGINSISKSDYKT